VSTAEAFALGDRVPTRVVEPSDAASVAATLHACANVGETAVAFGGGTLQTIGNAPRAFDCALSLRRLDRILAYDARDLTIGVEAGITLDALAARLAQHGQFIPFDAPRPARATVGGTLAAGWLGPRRASYGRLRDLAIGATAALADGTLASSGGMVVKNVTGYDLTKLYVGSLGTLGVLVRANFKTLPRPAAMRLALAPLSEDVRERAVEAIATLAIEPTAALIIHGFAGATPRVRDEDVRLAVLFEGSAAVIDHATRDLRSHLGAAGVAETSLLDGAVAERAFASIIDAYVEPLADRSITYRALGRPSSAWGRALVAREIAERAGLHADVIVDARTGDVIVRVTGRTREGIAAVLADFDIEMHRVLAHATVLAGDARLRALVDAWGPPPATIATMRALKTRFDPTGTLAPGRYVGGI
jgi:glycolate oxidase FAD binding subunit